MIIGGPYDPYTPLIIPIFVIFTFLIPVAFIFATKLIRKGKQQKLQSAIYLGSSFLFYGCAILVAFIGYLEVIIVGEFREIYRSSLPLGFSIGIIGNLCLLFFGFTLFSKRKIDTITFISWSLITLILVNLDSNWYGVPHSVYTGQFSIRFYSSLSMAALAFSIFSYLIIRINSLNTDKPLIKFGYRLIVWSLISFVFFWVFVVLDAVYINIMGEGFSIFSYIAWAFALLFWLLSYSGLMMPSKVKNFIERRLSKKSYIKK